MTCRLRLRVKDTKCRTNPSLDSTRKKDSSKIITEKRNVVSDVTEI